MAKLDNVRLGDTVVVVFTEALVLSEGELISALASSGVSLKPGFRRVFICIR